MIFGFPFDISRKLGEAIGKKVGEVVAKVVTDDEEKREQIIEVAKDIGRGSGGVVA